VKVLLINPPWGSPEDSIWHGISGVMPPLGTAWMAAVLEQDGHRVQILDCQAERLTASATPSVLRSLDRFDLVGITATTPQINPALAIAAQVKQEWPQSTVVLGGVHPTVLPEEVLSHPDVDLVVRGEGEETIKEIASGQPAHTITGVSFRDNGEIVHNPDRALIPDIDTLPMPAYHLLPMSRYFPAAGAYKRLPATSVLATRGCPGRCTFCYRIFGPRLRVRSGRLVAEEVKHLQERYGIKEICFYDDTFTSIKKEVYAFCKAVQDLKIDLTWSCFSRVDTVDEDLLRAMKESGCHQIMYGIEAASPEILKNIQKRIDLDKAVEAVRAAKKARIDVRAAFMIGNPGETKDTMEETLRFAIKLDPELIILNVTTPFPGTEMFDWADREGYLTTKDWNHYDLCHSVMKLPTLTQEELQEFYRSAYRRFYLRPRYIAGRVMKLRSLSDIASAIRGFRGLLGI
jgi:radical SAM superfamily enzyme YgiQ (UPF0313 family)